MGTIYTITNLINNKKYIGKTTRDPEIRWKEHIRESLNEQDNIPIHNAIRKYGLNNFSFEIIENNIPNSLLNQKEQEYIKYFNSLSHINGYNITQGGDGGRTSSKLTENEVKQIINILLDTNNFMSLSQIAKQFNINKSVIIRINLGETWKQEGYDYPLRKINTVGITISKEKYKQIINDILNTDMLLKEIQEKYNLSVGQITAINQGENCYGKNGFYQGLYTGDFPLRKDKKVYTQEQDYIPIFYEVLFTNNSMAKIGAKYGVQGPAIQGIISGKRRKELTKDYILPMRKNIVENQKIFLQLHPEFKGGD